MSDAAPSNDVRSAGLGTGGLPYIPAIDGLRALAIAAVVLYHAGFGWMGGGFLGVEVFFVISGYLVTNMLISGRAAPGGLSLAGFWQRRARRLLAAVVVLVAGVLAYCVAFLPGEVAGLRGDAAAALGYASNWYLIFENQSYFESLGRPSMLQHLWSLAIEEQFYIAWPIAFALVFGRLRRWAAVPLILGLAVASAVLMAVMYEPLTDPSRIYYGADTRASGLLIGAALAFVWNPGRLSAARNVALRLSADALGLAAIGALVGLCVVLSSFDPFLYRGGFALTAVLTAVLISAAVHPGTFVLGRVLGFRPLVWIGLRSYSIYLWHWPVFMLTRPGVDVSLDGFVLFALRLVVSLALAEVSYRLVETPVRRGLLGRWWSSLRQRARSPLSIGFARPLTASAGALAGVAALAAVVAEAEPPPPPPSLAVGEVRVVSWSDVGADERADYRRAHVTASPVPPTASPVPLTATPVAPTPTITVAVPAVTPVPYVPPPPPPPLGIAAPRVLAVGESVMLGAAPGLLQVIPNLEIDAAVSRQADKDLEVLRARRDAGTLGDIVILHIGNNGVITEAQFREAMEILSGVPRVVWVNLKLPDRYWEGPNNDLLARQVPLYSNATLIDWHAAGYARPDVFIEDRIHLNPLGYPYYAGLIVPYTQ